MMHVSQWHSSIIEQSSWWLPMAWHLSGARTFATIMMTWASQRLSRVPKANEDDELIYFLPKLISNNNQTQFFKTVGYILLNISSLLVLIDKHWTLTKRSLRNLIRKLRLCFSEWVIKFNGISGDSRQRGPCSPYKQCNHSLYIRITISPSHR